jgi:hypothetical protein
MRIDSLPQLGHHQTECWGLFLGSISLNLTPFSVTSLPFSHALTGHQSQATDKNCEGSIFSIVRQWIASMLSEVVFADFDFLNTLACPIFPPFVVVRSSELDHWGSF